MTRTKPTLIPFMLFVALLTLLLLSASDASASLAVEAAATAAEATGAAAAQSFNATLLGTVIDSSGAVVPGASVTIVEEDTGRQQTVTTGSDGAFTLAQLRPTSYTLRVELDGFQTSLQKNLVLEIDQTRRLTVSLRAGAVTETIEVNTRVPVINTDTSSKGEVIIQKQLQDLPLNGRNYTDLALLVPGVYRRPTDDDQGEGLATSGTRTDASNFILDGVVNRSDRNAATGVNASVDAIQEFNVQTSTYSAEYGRNAGAQINVVSKSGSNTIRGSLFEYLRNDAFDANNFFTPAGEAKSLSRHQFGGSVGGPLVKDHTFYFVSYERTRERRSESSLNTAPNANWLHGDFRNVRGAGADGVWGNGDDTNRIINPFTKQEFATPNVIPETMFDAVSKQILPNVPAANVPGGALDTYNAYGLLRANRNQLLTKVDQQLSSTHHLFVRWARQWSDGFDPFPSSRNFYPGFGRDTTARADSLAVSSTYILAPTLINEARLGYFDQHNENLGQHRDIDYLAQFGIPGLQVTKATQGYPAIRIDGYSEFGDRPNDPFIYSLKNLQFYDMLTWQRGRSSMKLGVDVIRSNYVEADVRNVRGDFRFRGRNTSPTGATVSGFGSFADFLLGLPDATQRQIGVDPANLTGWQIAAFAQNDWRVTPRLTLNLGIRYELQTPLAERNNRLGSFIPSIGIVALAGQNGYSDTLVKTDENNVAPRVGFAWRPFDDDRTVLRGGGGIFYSLETFNPIRQQLAVTYPFLVREQFSRLSSNPALLTFENPFPDGRGGVAGLTTPFGMNLDYRTPTFYQYNLTIERELGRDLSLEVGYVGSQGRYLGYRYNLNQPNPIGLSSTGTLVTARPYPDFGDIQFQDQGAPSSYNALQASLRRRAANGLTLLVSYTFSKSIDTASSTNNSTTGTQKFPQDVRNLAAERALSDFDRAHQFSGSFNYELPIGKGRRLLGSASGVTEAIAGGWQVNGVVTVLSGRPFTPQYSAADVSQQRPDLVGDPYAGVPAGLYFNPAAFARPVATAAAPDLFGNAGRNILTAPRFTDVDLSLTKMFALTRGSKLQFRAEAFNILNHPNFQVPVFLLDNSNVARVTSTANEGREFQFALRLFF
jgi:outer membrane receptor protein involved in Fe transport